MPREVKFFIQFFAMVMTGTLQTYYSQVGQDKYLNESIFNNKQHGVFVDVGAHDGISFSNTYFFEKELGWTGICLEPYPEFFQKLSTTRTSTCLPVCAGKSEGYAQFLKITSTCPYTEMLSGMLQSYNAAHLARIEAEVKEYGGSVEIIAVTVKTLTNILVAHNVHDIDFMSIDVEGGELDVIQGLDFSKFRIRYILIENNYKEKFSTIEQILINNNYKRIHSFDFDELFELQGA